MKSLLFIVSLAASAIAQEAEGDLDVDATFVLVTEVEENDCAEIFIDPEATIYDGNYYTDQAFLEVEFRYNLELTKLSWTKPQSL